MKHQISCEYKQEMYFEANVDGHKIPMDAAEEFGGKNRGPRPKPLVLAALSGCTGMDVVSVLNKMQIKFSNLTINVEGILADDHPKYYKKIHLVYVVSGQKLPIDKIRQAVQLSFDKYCGVLAALKPKAEITYEIKYNI